MTLAGQANLLPYIPNVAGSGPETSRPLQYVQHLGRAYPGLWRAIDDLRRGHNRRWPQHCFVAAEEVALLHHFRSLPTDAEIRAVQVLRDSGLASTLAAWRATQGVYRFHPTVLDAVWDTPLRGSLPVEALNQLPEWCPYVAFGDPRDGVAGFFVHPEPAVSGLGTTLRLLVDYAADGLEAHALSFSLGMSLEDAVRESLRKWQDRDGQPEEDSAGVRQALQVLEPLVTLTLFLCSETAEYRAEDGSGYHPTHPLPARTSRGPRLTPPSQPRVWEVSYRLGEALLRAGLATRLPGTDQSGPRGHIRRNHWHRFWTGPLNQPQMRRLRLRWLPPIPVNLGPMMETESSR